MARYELVLCRQGAPNERFEIPAKGLLVGRSAENDISLPDQMMSRRHARVWEEGEVLNVEDLNSRNGIEVNGAQVKNAVLKENDSITIGGAVFQVAKRPDSQFGRTVISMESAESVYESIVTGGQGANQRLPVLYKAAQLMGSVFDLDELLKEILALIFEALPVRRGFVILAVSQDSKDTEIRASLSKEQGDQGPPLSNTLIRLVFDNREAILTMDAQEDSRFDAAASIMGHGIHSAMCAPLCGRESVVGAIYVDSGTSAMQFSKDDLELQMAIARVVGVAVENARLYQENVARERLAAIGEATAGLGHCVKNILTGIRGGGEFINLALQTEDLKYVKKGWPILSQSIERIDGLVMNMLSFSKDREPERQLLDLNTLVVDTFEVVALRAEKANVKLAFERGEPVRAEVDAREIYRVVMNLVINAIEACESYGGTVTITCVSSEEGAMLRVEDTGTGIPPEILPKLSQAFVSTKGSSGTGLGLACSYKIVREHGGVIEVESEVGKGTQFTVYLPCVPSTPRPTVKLSLD